MNPKTMNPFESRCSTGPAPAQQQIEEDAQIIHAFDSQRAEIRTKTARAKKSPLSKKSPLPSPQAVEIDQENAKPFNATPVDGLEDVRTAARLLAPIWFENHALIDGDWYARDARRGHYSRPGKSATQQDKAVYGHLLNLIERTGLCYINNKNVVKPWPKTVRYCSDILKNLYSLAGEYEREIYELNPGAVTIDGVQRDDVYLVDGGQFITVDRSTGVVSTVDGSGAISRCIHLAAFPSVDGFGRLRGLPALEESNPVRLLTSLLCGGDVAKQRRLLATAGRAIFKRQSFDNDTTQSVTYWYGESGAGKTLFRDLVSSAIGDGAGDMEAVDGCCLSRENRFGSSALYEHRAATIDDIQLKNEHLDAILNLANKQHRIEHKGQESQQTFYKPNVIILSNFSLPNMGNAPATARRFCPVRFEATQNEGAKAARLVAQIAGNKQLLSEFISAAAVEYFAVIQTGQNLFERTVDDLELENDANDANPYSCFVLRYLEQSRGYQLLKNITLAAAKNAGFDRVAANKGLRDAIRAKFGRDAVSYDENHHPTARVQFTREYYAAVAWAKENDDTVLNYPGDDGAKWPAVEQPAGVAPAQVTAPENATQQAQAVDVSRFAGSVPDGAGVPATIETDPPLPARESVQAALEAHRDAVKWFIDSTGEDAGFAKQATPRGWLNHLSDLAQRADGIFKNDECAKADFFSDFRPLQNIVSRACMPD